MIKNILFDMDGTLLPMDMDVFVNSYFKDLARKAAPRGYRPEPLVAAVWKGTKAMVENDGSCTNEEAFWRSFADTFGEEKLADKGLFDDFYVNEFNNTSERCGFNPEAAATVRALKDAGCTLVLATNPLFPMVAQLARARWAGVDSSDFIYVTSYENSHYCKPNPDYYRELVGVLGLDPEECLMVGNDAAEDTVAETLGMKVFLLTDCLLNKDGRDISRYPQGSFPELREYLRGEGVDI